MNQTEKAAMQKNEIRNSLNRYVLERFKYCRPPVRLGLGCTMGVHLVKVDLYLRFLDDKRRRESPTIVIARIGFREERAGHGKHFLEFISKIALKYQYCYIEIESCNENSKAFAKRFGFVFIDKLEMNCRIEVKRLIKNLSEAKSVVN